MNDVNGFIIDRSKKDLLDLINYLVTDKERLKKWGKESSIFIKDNFSNNKIIPKINRIYEDLIKTDNDVF